MKKAYYADYIWFNSELIEKSWLLVDNDKIKGVSLAAPDDYSKEVFANSAIFPTLINTHTHMPMAYLRGYADDLPLMDWLNNHIWPIEHKMINEEFIYDATIFSTAELIKSGASCVNDMYFYAKTMAEAIDTTGIRALVGCGVMDSPTPQKNVDFFAYAEGVIEQFKNNPRVSISFCPHALYTVAPDKFKDVVKFVRKHDIVLHTHLSETLWEKEEILKRYGKTPAMLMDSVGGFDCKSIFAHCVHLTDEEIALMGSKKVNVSHCLQSNLKLASGFAPISQLMKAGANITIGTDGAASNNDQDMLSEMTMVSLFHKGLTGDPTVLDCKTILESATKNAAQALYLENVGELKDGYHADFMVVSFDEIHMRPVHNPLSLLIYSAKSSDITDMFVAGKQLMKNRKLTTIDENAVKAKALEWELKIKAATKK